MSQELNVNLSLPISIELAEIFKKDFDSDEIADKLVSRESSRLTVDQWNTSRETIEKFREGLRNESIELHSNYPLVLVIPVTFLLKYTEQEHFSYVDKLVDEHFKNRNDLHLVKTRLRKECRILHSQLGPTWVRINNWRKQNNLL